MNKFTGPTRVPTYEPKAKTTTSRHYSTSNYASSTGSGQSTTTRTSTIHAMTYSALPKPQEPPVNSAEYYQMMQQGSTSNTSHIEQSAAPPHIQGPAPGFGALRDRFKSGSVSENPNSIQDIRRQQQSNTSSSGLSSLRNLYIIRAKESIQTQEESFSQRIQTVSRSIAGEDPFQQQKQQQQTPSAPPPTPTPQISQQEESQVQSQSVDDQAASSEGAVAEGGSSSGASSLENETTITETDATPAPSSN